MRGFAGFYFPDDLLVTADSAAAQVIAERPCDDVVALLAAGEWRVTVLTKAPLIAVIERGARFGIITGGASASTCAVTIALGSMQLVSVTGGATAKGAARMYVLQCIRAGTDGAALLFYEGPGDIRLALSVNFPVAIGSHPLSSDQLTDATLAHSTQPLLDYLLTQFASPSSSDQTQQGSHLTAEGPSAGTVTIKSSDPLQGTFALGPLTSKDTGDQISISADFRCSAPA